MDDKRHDALMRVFVTGNETAYAQELAAIEAEEQAVMTDPERIPVLLAREQVKVTLGVVSGAIADEQDEVAHYGTTSGMLTAEDLAHLVASRDAIAAQLRALNAGEGE